MATTQLPPMNLNVPIIGSRPPPEVVEQHVAQLESMEALWPITPFPMSGNGIKVPGYWMGQTLLDTFALKAMEQLNWQTSVNNGPDAVLKQAQRVWLIATAMMQERPVGREQAPSETSVPTPESTGTDVAPPETSDQENGPRLVLR